MKGPSLDELIADERENPPVPAEGGAETGWRRVQKSVALGVAAPFDLPPSAVAPAVAKAAGTIAIAKVALAAVVTVGGIFVVGRVITSDSPEPAAVSGVEEAKPVPNAPAQAELDEPSSAVPSDPEVVVPPPVRPEAPIEPPPSSPEIADVEAEVPPLPSRRGRSRAARGAESPQPPAAVGIGRELDLIKRAGQAVNQGKHDHALTILSTHAKEFPTGALTEDREALRAIARCASEGDEASARVAASFSARFPRSVHAARVLEACSLEPEENL